MASLYHSVPAATTHPPEGKPPRLLDRLRFALRAKHYAYRTEQAYVHHWVRRFILRHGKRHPQEMAGPEIDAFLTHLAVRPPAGVVDVRPINLHPAEEGFCCCIILCRNDLRQWRSV